MRINIQRLVTSILISLVLPLTVAFLVDYSFGWTPLTMIGASLIFIPLSTILVVRATLDELDKVIRAVAPVPLDQLALENNEQPKG